MQYTLIEDTVTDKRLMVKSEKGDVVFEFLAKGSEDKSFSYPDGTHPFYANNLKIQNFPSNSVCEITNESLNMSPSDIWDLLEDMKDSGSLSFVSINNFLSEINIPWIKINLIEEKKGDCDCCGFYTITKFEIENTITQSKSFFCDNTHFYEELPDMFDLMSIIVDGKYGE